MHQGQPGQRAIKPADESLGIFRNRFKEGRENVQFGQFVPWPGRQIAVDGRRPLLRHELDSATLGDKP